RVVARRRRARRRGRCARGIFEVEVVEIDVLGRIELHVTAHRRAGGAALLALLLLRELLGATAGALEIRSIGPVLALLQRLGPLPLVGEVLGVERVDPELHRGLLHEAGLELVEPLLESLVALERREALDAREVLLVRGAQSGDLGLELHALGQRGFAVLLPRGECVVRHARLEVSQRRWALSTAGVLRAAR